MECLPQKEGLVIPSELESDQSSSIFNSENDRPISDSPESIASPPPIDKRLRISPSKQLLRRESALKDEGPVQWSLARAVQARITQRVVGAAKNNPNLHLQNEGTVN